MAISLLDRIFVWLRSKGLLLRLTVLTRILLAAGRTRRQEDRSVSGALTLRPH